MAEGNTGILNTGNRNAGDWNTGSLNTGVLNTGDRNTGSLNTGDRNTGSLNTGDWNTGDLNTGSLNTGNRNTGNWNTGDLNTGNRNTGFLNTGNRNTGSLNTGNRNTGFLNTGDAPVMFFDAVVPGLSWEDAESLIPHVDIPSFSCKWVEEKNMTDSEKTSYPSYKTTGGFLRSSGLTIQQAFPLGWAKLSLENKKRFLSLPNFDANKFLKCTGVDVRLDRDLFPQPENLSTSKQENQPLDNILVIDGKKYKLVPVSE